MNNTLVQGPSPLTATPPLSSTVKTNYKLVPGYIFGTAFVDISESEKQVFSLAMVALNKQTWAGLSDSQKKEVIETNRFVYLKLNDKSEVVDIGIHMAKCKAIEELGLSRVMMGQILLPKDISITAIPATSYANMIKKMVPQLI